MKNKELYSRALKLLGRKSYSEAELREKLLKYAGEKEVEEVIEECKKQHYLNERSLAEYLVKKNLQRNKGFWYIVSTLKKRKISEDIIREITENFDFDIEYKKAEEFVRKNRKKRGISSILFSLKAKGFSQPILNRIAGKYIKEGETGEEL